MREQIASDPDHPHLGNLLGLSGPHARPRRDAALPQNLRFQMIEDAYVRLYANDFAQMAGRSEMGQDVEGAVEKRLADARAHAVIMDDRKGPGHLEALIRRI